jgi:restriction endonuclease S subunit
VTRLAPYPEYRVWGDSWLPVVPSHWRTANLRHFAGFSTGWTPPTDDDAGYEGDHLWANISDLGDRWVDTTRKTISDDAVEGRRPAEPGDLLFSFKLSVGDVSRVREPMFTNEAIATFPPSDSLDLGYAFYALPVFLPMNANTNIYGAQLLNSSLIRAAPFAAPPLAEQLAIADYLDLETVQIDALIGKQEQLIETLRERRESVVARTLLRGLDTEVRTACDGSSALGPIPAHWSVVPTRHLRTITTGDEDSGNATEDGEYPFYIRGREILRIGHVTFDCEAVMTPGDGKGGTGKVFHYTNGKFVAHQRVYVFTDFRAILGWYFYYFLSTFLRPVALAGSNTVTMESLRRPLLADFKVALPPVDEQCRIAAYLDEQTTKFDALVGQAERFIELAKERRAALITAAVTGQIDVRTTTSAGEDV